MLFRTRFPLPSKNDIRVVNFRQYSHGSFTVVRWCVVTRSGRDFHSLRELHRRDALKLLHVKKGKKVGGIYAMGAHLPTPWLFERNAQTIEPTTAWAILDLNKA